APPQARQRPDRRSVRVLLQRGLIRARNGDSIARVHACTRLLHDVRELVRDHRLAPQRPRPILPARENDMLADGHRARAERRGPPPPRGGDGRRPAPDSPGPPAPRKKARETPAATAPRTPLSKGTLGPARKRIFAAEPKFGPSADGEIIRLSAGTPVISPVLA